MKGRKSETFDEKTEDRIDELLDEAESSKAYKTFKAYQDTPDSATNSEDGWRLQDPKLRERLRDQAEEELGLLNHKLRKGEWVRDTLTGKRISIMDTMMRMDELRDFIKMMDKVSEYDTLPPQEPSSSGGTTA